MSRDERARDGVCGERVQLAPLSPLFSVKTRLSQCGGNLCGKYGYRKPVARRGAAHLDASSHQREDVSRRALAVRAVRCGRVCRRQEPATALGTPCPSAGDRSLFMGVQAIPVS